MISKIAEGKPREAIIAGIHQAIGERLRGMVSAVGMRPPLALTGGVAKNQCMQSVLKNLLQTDIFIPEEPQIVGALGAAIFAADSVS